MQKHFINGKLVYYTIYNNSFIDELTLQPEDAFLLKGFIPVLAQISHDSNLNPKIIYFVNEHQYDNSTDSKALLITTINKKTFGIVKRQLVPFLRYTLENTIKIARFEENHATLIPVVPENGPQPFYDDTFEFLSKSLEKPKKTPEQIKLNEEKEKEIRNKLCTPVTTNLETDDFSNPRCDLFMNLSFLKKGIFINSTKFIHYHSFEKTEVCNPMKKDIDNEDVMMYLPQEWVNFAGYDKTFIQHYIREIEKLCGFEIKLFTDCEFANLQNIGDPLLYHTPSKNLFYCAHLKGSENYMIRYFAFNLLRYLYLSSNNNIPGLTMQLMKYLRTDDFFKCLLIAHSCSQGTDYTINPYQRKMGSNTLCSITTNKEEFLNRIIKRRSLSDSIDYIIVSPSDLNIIRKAVNEKNFKYLEEFLSTFKSQYEDESYKIAPKSKFSPKVNVEAVPFQEQEIKMEKPEGYKSYTIKTTEGYFDQVKIDLQNYVSQQKVHYQSLDLDYHSKNINPISTKTTTNRYRSPYLKINTKPQNNKKHE